MNKTTVSTIGLLVLCLSALSLSSVHAQNLHEPNQVIIKFKNTSSQAYRANFINQLGTLLQDDNNNSNIGENVLINVASYPVTVNGHTYTDEVDLIGSMIGNDAEVDGTDLNYIITSQPYNFSQFLGASGLNNYSPIAPSCEAAYPGGPLLGEPIIFGLSNPPGSNKIVVAILDSGLDPYYPTINRYVTGAIDVLADNNNNGFAELSFPYDPFNPIAVDELGHGTAVTGIIAGLSHRANVSPADLEIVIIKCFGPDGKGRLYDMIQAVRYLDQVNPDAINLSWSYTPIPEDEASQILEDQLTTLSNSEGVIIITGAGNNSLNLDQNNLAPAGLTGLNNLITVGGNEGINCMGGKSDFSNYGAKVDLCAPSASIIAPGLGGYWNTSASGTSFAAPIVTAAVIQTWLSFSNANSTTLYNPNYPHPVRDIIVNTATYVPALALYNIFGVINFSNATSYTNELSQIQSQSNDEIMSQDVQEKTNFESNINVYPNPFSEEVSISMGKHSNSNSISIELWTTQGQKVLSRKIDNIDSADIKLQMDTKYPDGLYLLRINNGEEVYTKVIVKK